jgi:uncharacterized protein (TIGR02145 family)
MQSQNHFTYLIQALTQASMKICPMIFALLAISLLLCCSKENEENNVLTAQSGTITDIEGNVYKTVEIGTQTWMVENLKTTKYSDGKAIFGYIDYSPNMAAYCWYNNNENNKDYYGALYTWYAVKTGKLCPSGWHVPTNTEWTNLVTYAGGWEVAGGKLKEKYFGSSPGKISTDEYGFTARPGGLVAGEQFTERSINGYWWSGTANENQSQYSFYYKLLFDSDEIQKFSLIQGCGMSVRCIKN